MDESKMERLTTKDARLIFEDEKELQDAICKEPNLLKKDGDPNFFLIGKEVTVASGGRIDVLLLDESGKIVVVEVKLGRNSQAGMYVVGQITEYKAYLAGLSYYQLNTLLHGKLETAVDSINNKNLRANIDMCLTSGSMKAIIAIDEPPDNLRTSVLHMKNNENVDIELVAIQKLPEGDHYKYQASHVIEENIPRRINNPNSPPQRRGNGNQALSGPKEFLDLITLWNNDGDNTDRQAEPAGDPRWHEIFIPGWPKTFYYEFYYDRNRGAVEVCLKNRLNDPIRNGWLEALTDDINRKTQFQFEYNLPRIWGKIRKIFPVNNIEDILSCMEELIEYTQEPITEKLKMYQ